MNSNCVSTSSRLGVFLGSFLIIAAGIAIAGGIGLSRSGVQHIETNALQAGKIAPWVIEHTADGQQAEFFIVLADQADVSGAAALHTKAEKGRYVYDALWNKSQITQEPILQWLRARGIKHRSFYIVNAILVKGTRKIADALAARVDVARIEGNPHIQNPLPVPNGFVESPPQPQKPETIEPGIQYTHAPDVWALGVRGQGVTVAGADTGERWTHNALKPHYRGWHGVTAGHNHNRRGSIHHNVVNPCNHD